MTRSWTLKPEGDGTRLRLHRESIEALSRWWRFAMTHRWDRMIKTLLLKVLQNVKDGGLTPAAVTTRDYGTKTVPVGHAK